MRPFFLTMLRFALLCSVLIGVLLAWLYSDRGSDPSEVRASPIAAVTSGEERPEANMPQAAPQEDPLQRLYRELLDILMGYKDQIHLLSTQLSLVEARDYVVSIYPRGGLDLFYRAIFELYPEHADQIIENLTRYEIYQQWLAEQSSTFADMDNASVKAMVWKKRIELFGEASREIWSDQVGAYESRRDAAQSLFEELNAVDVLSNDEKLYQLTTALDEVFNYSIEGFVFDRTTVSHMYLNIASVQTELAELPEEQRLHRLSEMRRQMGYSEPQIAHLKERDTRRNQRWENGYSYMSKRERLAEQYGGEELAIQLDTLRDEYFGHEAPTIAREEEQGFFRYKRPRVIGLN
ncbi:MAG: hypothetical protein AAGF57_01660 [Pseudomonadota bacterium]